MTPNQKEFKRLQSKIKRMVRELEKQGLTFSRSPVPEKPKRVTQKRLELLSKIKRQTLREYAEYTNKWETPIEIYTKRHALPDIYLRKGKRKGRKLGSINKNPRLTEKKRKAPSEKKARKQRPPKPPKTPEEPPTQEPTQPVPPEEPSSEEPTELIPFESDIIIDNLRDILKSVEGFKGLAEHILSVLDNLIKERGVEEVARNIKGSPDEVFDDANKLVNLALRYSDEAVELSSNIIRIITGTDIFFDGLRELNTIASMDAKDVSQYKRRNSVSKGFSMKKNDITSVTDNLRTADNFPDASNFVASVIESTAGKVGKKEINNNISRNSSQLTKLIDELNKIDEDNYGRAIEITTSILSMTIGRQPTVEEVKTLMHRIYNDDVKKITPHTSKEEQSIRDYIDNTLSSSPKASKFAEYIETDDE